MSVEWFSISVRPPVTLKEPLEATALREYRTIQQQAALYIARELHRTGRAPADPFQVGPPDPDPTHWEQPEPEPREA